MRRRRGCATGTSEVQRYDPREIRLRRRFEMWFERLGERAVALGVDGAVRWAAWPLDVAADLRPRDFIVVLSGGIRSSGQLNATTAGRVRWAVELYHRGLGRRLIMSGGPRRPGRPPSAPAMRRLAEECGVPSRDILVESASSRTAENAHEVAALLGAAGPREVLLVTSRLHMRRALLCFAQAGVSAGAAPVPAIEGEPPARASLLSQVLHEYGGLLYYRLRGWI